MKYLVTPFVAWFVAGTLKFAVNCLREKRVALDLVGYGGLPSNHSAIVTSMAALIAFSEGLNTPAFGVAVTLAFIVMLDATSLRKAVGRHAVYINKLADDSMKPLRERMGHTKIEVFSGALVGAAVAGCVHYLLNG